MLDNQSMYDIFKTKDARYDGRFFVGVSSTGIYCRPICHAKIPKQENCTYYSTAAQAEKAGYRPCLLCRPELAPGNAIIDASSIIASQCAKMLEKSCSDHQSISDIAYQLGCSDRHLRRVFLKEYNVTPIQYLQTFRLLFAKRLLTDTKISIIDVAMASGFKSLRRFNDAFKTHYKLTPTDLRKKVIDTSNDSTSNIKLSLSYRPPYQWQQMLSFLKANLVNGVELISDDKYYRVVRFKKDGEDIVGWLEVANDIKKNALLITIHGELLSYIPHILARVRHLFDVECDPQIIYNKLKVINEYKSDLIIEGTRLPGCFEPFEIALITIIKEHSNKEEASKIINNIIYEYAKKIKTNYKNLNYSFITLDDIIDLSKKSDEQLNLLNINRDLSNKMLALAKAFVNEDINFYHPLNPDIEIEKMTTILNIEEKVAKYIALRTMELTNTFIYLDNLDSKISIDLKTNIEKRVDLLNPWKSYLSINLLNNYKGGQTNDL
ncbi:AraC family transcriptional regulator of adaptative response / DNA-3-methyladenine glycosylase II [Bacilli bacterium PM5-3]|nr:AraC family transcriptional regulator of adaptative response / DNA-3-methyladenine glycosylase II [Bacilli bacterium PM5-3]MDH6603620.1 AraC family transcriptional regulator of adaptative response / DNA-3-methyladenine glycosylase II [Bacilli bacterium PM5-9]